MASNLALKVDYHPLTAQGPERWDGVLGVAAFDGRPPRALSSSDIPVAEVRTPVLGSTDTLCEIWRTQRPVESGQHGRVRYRHDGRILFGCISVEESIAQDDASGAADSALHNATELAYREVFAALGASAYPHLVRVWNYLPQINLDTHGLERYRQFNSARRAALFATGRDVTGNVPAACALGSATGSPLVVYFLAAREEAAVIENPRQVSAYEYPSRYGPRPAFSRASAVRSPSGSMLFISGTASIVGHETVHVGDAAAQTRETLVNIEALLDEAKRVTDGNGFDIESLAYKVYVRNRNDLPVIQSELRAGLGSQAHLIYLQADICRQDLLVEIEAVGTSAAT
jgi:chorismate lyase / 3-hydroxybenzoate synthase